ncbi:MAG TPA: Mur ligase family protein [Spirochaetota bacterium]|nr:Mur ligase family protein [Spirochaetota bacterium]HPJ39222.1 Mur ligase family protein [Spirochaetota bacterium]
MNKIYLIGICGVAMGSLAGMLKDLGYDVSGSDEHVYPPMSDKLRDWDIPVFEGFSADNIVSPDLVIIGNAVSRGNPEAEYVLNNRIPYMSMARAFAELVMPGKEVIAVCGTHGKTTTTALLAYILDVAGLSPSFFVGGVARNYNSNFKIGEGRFFVIEGDEYDSAFFEKIPKFIVYRPHHCILTSLEFDHADIYANIDEIILWFKRLVSVVPENGNIIYSGQYPVLGDVIAGSRSKVVRYGVEGADYSVSSGTVDGEMISLQVVSPGGGLDLGSELIGDFNYQNILAAVSMAVELGVDKENIQEAVKTFKGVKRRQELLFSSDPLKIYEDFAHHPTSIRSIISAMRKRYPSSVIWSIYEPRSATSRRNVFQDSLGGSFLDSDYIAIKTPYKLSGIAEEQRIDTGAVVHELKKYGKDAVVFDVVDDVIEDIFNKMKFVNQNIVIIMSNGGFDGIYRKIVERAQALSVC